MSREDYEVIIGLEVHAELSTKTLVRVDNSPTIFALHFYVYVTN